MSDETDIGDKMCRWCLGDNYDESLEWDDEYDLDNGDIPETDDEMYKMLERGITE